MSAAEQASDDKGKGLINIEKLAKNWAVEGFFPWIVSTFKSEPIKNSVCVPKTKLHTYDYVNGCISIIILVRGTKVYSFRNGANGQFRIMDIILNLTLSL